MGTKLFFHHEESGERPADPIAGGDQRPSAEGDKENGQEPDNEVSEAVGDANLIRHRRILSLP